ncbi:MAG: HEAT repeat domain-containing protein [Chthonomonadales bacterium]|nr:HEAT repeat domain-containing protein [Chthonomonadales bacterium]
MKSLRYSVITAAIAFVHCAPIACRAQTDPFDALRSYDLQNRSAIHAIERRITAAARDAQRLAEIETALLRVLPDADFAGLQETCRLLGLIGSQRSVAPLARLLDSDLRKANAARYALERINAPEASRALRLAASRSTGLKQIGAINSLGVRRDPQSVSLLKRLLRARDAGVRAAAIRALGRIGTRSALSVLAPLSSRERDVWQARIRCAQLLAREGQAGVAIPVFAALVQPAAAPAARVASLKALAELHAPAFAAVALTALADRNSLVHSGAARVVTDRGDASLTQRVFRAFDRLPADSRRVLLEGWADRRYQPAAELAITTARTGPPALQAAAVRAAARCGGARMTLPLAELAANGAGVAQDALATLSGPGAAAAVLNLARNPQPGIRAVAMTALAERPGSASMTALLKGASDGDHKVALAALDSLRTVARAADVDEIGRVLISATESSVRDGAARALIATAQRTNSRPAAVDLVADALPAASADSRIAILGVLAELGGERALRALEAAASDTGDPSVQRAALQGLAVTWADSSGIPVLFGLATRGNDRTARILALRGYIRLVAQDGGAAPEAKAAKLAEALRIAERPEEQKQAIAALRDCRTETAVTVLAQRLGDAALSHDAAEAILDLAAKQRRYDRDLPAVTGQGVSAALDRIIDTAKDEALKTRARRIRQQGS